jgi:hypothetical protein
MNFVLDVLSRIANIVKNPRFDAFLEELESVSA